jgi:osmotically-inducible protein OsmY
MNTANEIHHDLLAGQYSPAAEAAEARLRGNAYLALRNVSCTYGHGVLTLRGSLPSYYLKQVAGVAVAEMEGVERVANEIEVVSGPSRSR